MDLGKIAEDAFGNLTKPSATKKSTKKKTNASASPFDDVLGGVDDALKRKLPKSPLTDIAEGALDQNKDGRIIDDIARLGENFFKKKK